MRIIGLMSGTSCDGVDVAAAAWHRDSETLWLEPLGTHSLPYDDGLRAAIARVLPPGQATIEAVCQLDNRLGQLFAEAAEIGVRLAGGAADLVVCPGQTVFHWVADGQAWGTLQLGAPAGGGCETSPSSASRRRPRRRTPSRCSAGSPGTGCPGRCPR